MRECRPCLDRQRDYAWRGMPDLPTRYTVIEIANGTDHGTWETPMEVAGALAFAKLSLDEVEILTDGAAVAAFPGPCPFPAENVGKGFSVRSLWTAG